MVNGPTALPGRQSTSQPPLGGNLLPQVDAGGGASTIFRDPRRASPRLTIPTPTPVPAPEPFATPSPTPDPLLDETPVEPTVDDTELRGAQDQIETLDTDITRREERAPGEEPTEPEPFVDPTRGIEFPEAPTIKPVTAFDVRGVKNRERNVQLQTLRNATPIGSARQRRRLTDRKVIEDHFDVRFMEPATMSMARFTVSPTGSIANGREVGRFGSREIDLTPQRLNQSTSRVAEYALRFPRMSDFQRSAGAVDTFYGTVRPYLTKNDFLPSTQLVSDTVGSLNIGLNWSRLGDLDRFVKTSKQIHNLARDLRYDVPKQATNSLALLNLGYSAYNLLNNWERMSPIQRSIASLNSINSGAQAYTAGSAFVNSLSGTGTTGTAFQAAFAAEQGAAAVSPLLQAVPYVAGAVGAYAIVDQWGKGGAQGRVNGASSGSAVGSMWGPWGMAIGAALGVAIGSIKTGKSPEQQSRDALRDRFEQAKIFEKKENVHFLELADGSFYNVGIDGADGRAKMSDGSVKKFANPSKIPERDKGTIADNNELRPYDIDFTNDLDFVTSLSTKLVNLIPVGGTTQARNTTEAAQMNGYLTNAATSNVGRDFTSENFSKVMSNVRKQYEKLGIRDKSVALQSANRMREQNKLSNDDYNAIILGVEFAFSENFDRASQLLTELNRGESDTASTEDSSTEGIAI